MSEITILLKRVCAKANLLKTAYETNQDAYLAHHLAGQRWLKDPSQDNAKLLVDTECAWENARDTITTLLRGLLDKTNELLAVAKPDEFKALRKAAAHLEDGFREETAAFTEFSKAFGDITEKREAWEACSAEVISRGWPLLERIQSLMCGKTLTGTGWHATQYFEQVEGLAAQGKPQTPPPPDPLAVHPDTDLDGASAHNTEIPAWALAETKAEQDEIIYQNRAAIMGKKRAGQATYAIPRAIANRRGQWVYTDDPYEDGKDAR